MKAKKIILLLICIIGSQFLAAGDQITGRKRKTSSPPKHNNSQAEKTSEMLQEWLRLSSLPSTAKPHPFFNSKTTKEEDLLAWINDKFPKGVNYAAILKQVSKLYPDFKKKVTEIRAESSKHKRFKFDQETKQEEQEEQNKAAKNREEALKTFGLSGNPTKTEITEKYKKLALKWHPDKNRSNTKKATEKMQEINSAYEILIK